MQVKVEFLDNLKLKASFDNYSIIADQPVRYKGDATAPGPYDYFLASSALCAAYFVKLYCKKRDIPTEDIRVTQNNIVDPDNRYNQDLNLEIELPDNISERDREGILRSMDRCTVKRVVQNSPGFKIEAKEGTNADTDLEYRSYSEDEFKTQIPGKDCSLEETITNMRKALQNLGINIEISSWRNPVPHVWSVHIRDAESPMCYTNGKGSTQDSALCSALGEYFERISNNFFYNDYYLGPELAADDFVHYPDEHWFKPAENDDIPQGLMDEYLREIYNPEGELKARHLIDTNSGNTERGICAIPFMRFSDGESVYIPVNLVGNLFVSNGMSAGNTIYEARVQCLSEIFERAIKNNIIVEELSLPDVPQSVLKKYPKILEGIQTLEEKGYPVLVKDASLGGKFPVMCVTLMNPKNGGVFASFGAHPNFEVALERSLTELLQGRSFEGLNDTAPPTFNSLAVTEHTNIEDHFIDSTGVISWKFFSEKSDYDFCEWDFSASTKEEFEGLMEILRQLEKEVYITDFEDLGIPACRILVPNFSEVYPADDLVWDNHNDALNYREDILNIHQLDEKQRRDLLSRLEESGIDDYKPISEVIGVTFEESDAWARLTVGELKGLTYLSLGDLQEAKEQVEMFLLFNDNTVERRKYYQAMNVVLDIYLDEALELKDYLPCLKRMYGEDLMDTVVKSANREMTFYNLTPTDSQLTGLDKHTRLIESYKKLQKARRKNLETTPAKF